jgi:hypothetical protein
MDMNDPFGRLGRRHDASYASVRESLQRANVETVQAAEAVRARMLKNSLQIGATGLIVLLVVGVIFPDAFDFMAVVTGITLVWVASTTVRGRGHVRRYMVEELGARGDVSDG